MNQYREITTLQYMGSKTRILPYICDPIIGNKNITKIIDLFAGTGAIGYALKDEKNVVSNDIEYYAYIINQAILNGCNFSKTDEESFLEDVYSNYSLISSKIKDCICSEKLYFENDFDYMEYKNFCDNTPSVFTPDKNDPRFTSLSELVKTIVPGSTNSIDVPCLFLTYYSNTYFGIDQCCQIDAIRNTIESVNDMNVKNVLLTVLMSVMSSSASTTTHFAQFLKVNSNRSCKNLIEKRKINIINSFITVLEEYRLAGLCEKRTNQDLFQCFNKDYLACLNEVSLDKDTLVYADPPYFKEHYSRYYHILNTLCLYDYPSLSINHQTKKLSVGRYREGRAVSDFGKKAKALNAFEKLIDVCSNSGAWLMISYSDNSIVDIKTLQELAEKKYDVTIKKVELHHSNQGRLSMSKVDEYIFICSPKNVTKSIEENLNEIKSLKPVVDNPAGMMHNYMARKPYNVVSELINRFCPVDGCVYDPMFGSGTTLIEASKLGRRSVGTDINSLAYKLCYVSLKKWDLVRINSLIDDFVNNVKRECEKIYSFIEEGEERILERCHFDQGENCLIPKMYWYKRVTNGKISGRKKSEVSPSFMEEYSSYSTYVPRNIEDSKLVPNSRIAIGDNDTVYKYFCYRNLKALDSILDKLKLYRDVYGYEVLELIVSSSINLIKLSDKKASSQLPYWLPKINVTSRNAVIILEQKAKVFKEGLTYLSNNCKFFLNEESNDNNIIIQNVAAQMVPRSILADNTIDLVLTDPPYTDQVPYLEYSQLWYKIMNWKDSMEDDMNSELVVSDAPSRCKDISNFNSIFEKIIQRIVPSIKENGYFIIFYHSFDLTSWSHILTLMHKNGLKYCGQVPSATPRKSFKTVMTPKGTLNGNYIVVFQKKKNCENIIFNGTLSDAEALAISCARRIISKNGFATSQDIYDQGMLKESFELGYLPILAKKYSSFIDIMSNEFMFIDGVWREKICTGC